MATRFPQDRLTYSIATTGAPTLLAGANAVLTVYSDEAGTILAGIVDALGVPLPGSRVTVDSQSLLPYFFDPQNRTRLWVKPVGDTKTYPVDAVTSGEVAVDVAHALERIGNLALLQTVAKANLVAAVNEVLAAAQAVPDLSGLIEEYIAQVRGAAGGLAGLDADGDVVDAEGAKILAGGGGVVSWESILDKPTFSIVSTSGLYSDLLNKPILSTVANTGSYADLTSKPNLAQVATSGLYTDLSARPSLAAVATSGSYTDLSNRPAFASVATTGSYADLTNKPNIPTVPTTLPPTAGSVTQASMATGLVAMTTSERAALAAAAPATDVAGLASRTGTLEGQYTVLAGNMDNLGGRIGDLEVDDVDIKGRLTALEAVGSPVVVLANGANVPVGTTPPKIILWTA